jgi:sortase A
MVATRARARWAQWVATVVALLVAVVAITVALNSANADRSTAPPAAPAAGPSADDVGAAAPEQQKVQTDPALVTRMLADLRAGRKPESQDQPLAGAPIKLIQASPDKATPIGALSIPSIGVRTRVFEGVNEEALRDGPGHWPGTPGFGQPGNTVLSGHRSTETRPFLYLDRLSRGDLITITEGGQRYRYAVDDVTIVPQAGYVRYVLEQPANPRTRMVTLFACNPLTAHYQRIVVRARALDGGRPA